jgi:Zn-dependent protease
VGLGVEIAIIYLTLLASLVIHEASHALFAKIGGDMTAYTGGQVTLNPIPHIRREPFGTVFLPLLMLFSSGGAMCMGYAHIPVDPVWAYRHPRRAALMSAAGPFSNLLLATVAFMIMKGLLAGENVEEYRGTLPAVLPFVDDRTLLTKGLCLALSYLLILNILLFTINLIPIPPLDGAGVVEGLFPNSLGRIIRELKRQPIVILIVMIGLLFSIMKIMGPIYTTVKGWL